MKCEREREREQESQETERDAHRERNRHTQREGECVCVCLSVCSHTGVDNEAAVNVLLVLLALLNGALVAVKVLVGGKPHAHLRF